MNRRSVIILFSALVLAGAFYFRFFSYPFSQTQAQKSDENSNQTDQHGSVLKKKEKRQVSSESETVVQQPDVASSPNRSGKYSIKSVQMTPSIENQRKSQFEFLEKNSTGLQFQSSDQKYVVMKLRALREKASGVLDQHLGHEVFPINADLAKKVIIDDESYPVVFNESNGRVGFLTGVILLQPQLGEEIRKIVSRYPVEIQIYDESIGLATLKVHQGEDLFEVYNRMRQNERVNSISMEILDSYKGI